MATIKYLNSDDFQHLEEPRISVISHSGSVQLQSPSTARIIIENNESQLHQRKQIRQETLEHHVSDISNSDNFSETLPNGEVLHESNDSHEPLATSSKEAKCKMTKKSMSMVLSIVYAIFLVTFGCIIYITDAFVTLYPLPEAFSITIICISFAYFIALVIDIRVHLYRTQKVFQEREYVNQLIKENKNNMNVNKGLDLGDEVFIISKSLILLQHKYCFTTGRHGEFLYLKLGATWFCLGLVVHSALQITYQVSFFTSTDPIFLNCGSILSLIQEILFPVYSICILFFIFKYINVIVNINREIARIFLMHAIGTSAALWIRAIVHETVDAINLSKLKDQTEEYEQFEYYRNQSMLQFITEPHKLFSECPGSRSLNTIYKNFSPYFYPFIIEFCILVAGIWYLMWSNISQCPVKHSVKEVTSTMKSNDIDTARAFAEQPKSVDALHSILDHEINLKSSNAIVADCHAAHRGLFAGLFLMILTIVDIILFFVAVSEVEYFEIGKVLNRSFELCVLVAMTVCTLLAYIQTSTLDINTHSISKLDDVLLFIAVPAFFLETTFSMLPAILNNSNLNITIIVMQLVQILLQTPWIIDALRRCSNSQCLRDKKPGRELVTFMAIANVSLWVYYTFSVKTGYIGDERYEFYGYTLWKILNHVSMPLIMFYRFHSSVCLVDIWKHSYEPGGH